MKMTDLQIKQIVDTLPIGYYIGRNVPVSFWDEECSAYDPEKDCMIISADQIRRGLDKVSEDDFATAETLIRSNFYHEISHAFLTPFEMHSNDQINIFEDERIETLLSDYYYGVDFEKSLNAVNDRTQPPTNPIQAFFALVRFRIGKPDMLKRVDEIINNHRKLYRGSSGGAIKSYVHDIQELFNDLCEEMDENPEQYWQEVAGESEGESDSEPQKGEGEPKEGESSARAKLGKMGKGLGRAEIMAMCDKQFQPEIAIDTKLTDTLSRLFENYKRKNSGGTALQAHSGVLNPRLADRPDYRLFERASSVRGNNSFGSFHLNLFIDISGSFCSNQNTTNEIIRVLESLEKTNPLFSFDVITINYQVKLLNRSNRYIDCDGGNHLTKEIFDIYRRQQFPMTYNYNIVMFDGDAYSNDASRNELWVPNGYGFLAFAQNNVTIVTDTDNRPYIEKYCPTTRTIYTHRYNDELKDNIIKVLYQVLS